MDIDSEAASRSHEPTAVWGSDEVCWSLHTAGLDSDNTGRATRLVQEFSQDWPELGGGRRRLLRPEP